MTPEPIGTRLEADMKVALREGDRVRLGAIRRARAALKNAEIAARGALSEDAAERTLRGIVKQHRESIEQFAAGGRQELVEREAREMGVVESYLPQLMDAGAVEAVVADVIAAEGASDPGDLGRVMKAAMSRLRGRADGSEVRAVAQRLLEEES